MKKIVSAIALCAAASTFAADAVYSANIVGFQKIEVPIAGTYNLASINFVGENGVGLAFSELFGDAALIFSGRSNKADRIITWDNEAQVYKTYYQKYDDGVFYDVSTGAPVDPVMQPGQGFWLYPAPSRTEPLEITASGDVPMQGSVQINVEGGLSMLGTPFAVAFELNDPELDWVAAGATANNRSSKADVITTWDGEKYVEYFFKDGAWYNISDKQLATDKINLGEGFFYRAKGNVNLTIVSPY